MSTALKHMRMVLVLWLIIVLFGCSDDELTNVTGETPDNGPATLAKRIERNNDFAFKLYAELESSDENLIISPHSIITCFGMAYAGARGNTERQIADILCFNYPQGGFHSILERLNDTLASRQGIDLRIANGCWGRDDLPYETSYLDTLSVHYGASIEYLDFGGHAEESRQTINQWVKDHTAGYIDELLPPNSIDGFTYLVLANTVYFIADWLHQFDPDYTFQVPFTLLDGSQVDVPIMYGEETMPYYEGSGYRAMAMPYRGGEVSMILIVPDEGGYRDFEASFSTVGLDSIVTNLKDNHITFRIPKFGFYSGFDLSQAIYNMGVTDAFTPGLADFSGMDGVDDGVPWIDWVVHKSYIMINEYGTLAFSGTGMGLTLGVHDSFNAVRPFIFVILDIPTGTILFMGRVLDPSAS
jgi:serpin B